MSFQTVNVEIHDGVQRLQRALNSLLLSWGNVLLEELIDSLVEVLCRKLALPCPSSVDDSGQGLIKLCWHPRMKSRELGTPFAIRKFGIPQDLNNLLEGLGHDDLIVI